MLYAVGEQVCEHAIASLGEMNAVPLEVLAAGRPKSVECSGSIACQNTFGRRDLTGGFNCTRDEAVPRPIDA